MQSDIINKHAMQRYGKDRRRSKKNALASSAMIWSKAETNQKQAKANETEKKKRNHWAAKGSQLRPSVFSGTCVNNDSVHQPSFH